MKRITLAICAALASGAASADTILGFDASAGVWMPSYGGTLGTDGFNVDELSLDEKNITFLQAALEHPVPLVPNVMLTHSKIETSGEFAGNNFDFDLSHTDATLYYEILDNWVNLDIGLTARDYTAEMTVDAGTFDNSATRAMAYGMARFDLPFTGWSVVTQGNVTDYSDTAITDLTAKVRWDFAPALDFAVEAGYRVMDMDLQDPDGLQMDVDVKGPYLGLNLHL